MKMRRLTLFHIICLALLIIATDLSYAETLSRSEAILMALGKNPDVISAENEWEAALARVTQEKAFPDPEFEIEFEELPNDMSLGDYGERNIGFVQQIEYPVKWLFRLKSAKRSAEATKLAVYETTKLEVASSVKAAYDRVLVNRKILEYEELNLILVNEFYEKARLRYDAGDVSQLEILRAGVELGRSKNRVSRARSKLEVSKAELNTLLARVSDSPLELSGELTYSRIDIEQSELKRMALENRPDLRGAALYIESLEAGKSEIKASIFPDLAIGMFRQTITEPLGRENFWRLSLALEIPVWAFYRQRGSIQEASAEIRQAASQQVSLRSNILLEVETAIHEFTAAREQMELFNVRVLSLAEKSYDTALRSYEEGKATYLELMDAQKALTETRIEYTETLFNYKSAVIGLERYIGKDIEIISK